MTKDYVAGGARYKRNDLVRQKMTKRERDELQQQAFLDMADFP